MKNSYNNFKIIIFISSVIIIILSPLFNSASSQVVDHWETVVYSGNVWKYFIGAREPETGWRSIYYQYHKLETVLGF